MTDERTAILYAPSDTLVEHEHTYAACIACPLGHARHVLYRGNSDTDLCGVDILFIGEGPGEQENASGIPFIGPAGCRLDIWIRAALKEFSETFRYGITNTVACRPTRITTTSYARNRKPTHDEMDACRPRLRDLIDTVKPATMISVGTVAQSRMSEIASWSRNTIPYYHIIHPAYVIRNVPYESATLTSECYQSIRTIIKAGMKAKRMCAGITREDIMNTRPPKAGEL